MLRGFKGKRPSDIYRMMSVARQEGRNPPALFLHFMGVGKSTTAPRKGTPLSASMNFTSRVVT